MSTAAPLAIQVDGLHKTFKIPTQRSHTLKERALHPFGMFVRGQPPVGHRLAEQGHHAIPVGVGSAQVTR